MKESPTVVSRITCALLGALGGYALGAGAVMFIWLFGWIDWNPTLFWAVTCAMSATLALLGFVFAKLAEPGIHGTLDLIHWFG